MKNGGKILKTCTYFLVLVLVTMSVLVACAKPAPAPTTTAPAPAPTTTAPAPAPTTTAPAPAPAPSITKVIIGTPTEPDTLDPTMTKLLPQSQPISCNIYEAMVSFTYDGKPTPRLATWEVSADGKTFAFTLRQGVKFSNGDPLTTKDVLFSHERSMKNNPQHQMNMRNLDKVEVIDDYKINFIFKAPDVGFLPNHSLYIVSKSYYDRVGEEKFVANPVGTGPYKLVEWKLGQYMDLTRNEDYWEQKPTLMQARFLFVKEPTTRVAMLKVGEVDMTMDTPWQNVAELEKAGMTSLKITSGGLWIRFHTMNPNVPWYDKRVRQAVAYAVDKEAIIKSVFAGIPTLTGWQEPGDIGYDPALKAYPYDIAKAKALLAEAGYPNGFQMPLYYSITTAGMKDIAEAVTLGLNAIGIKCNVIGQDQLANIQANRAAHTDPTAQRITVDNFPIPNAIDPLSPLTRQMHSTGVGSFYKNPQVDALIDKASITVDDTQRGELLKQIFRILHEDVAAFQVLASVSVISMKPNVNFTRTKAAIVMMYLKDVK